MDAKSPAKQTRNRGPNTKEGCPTCKIRRKRCDGTRPACVRCTSTGRTCDFASTLQKVQVERSLAESAAQLDTHDIAHGAQAVNQTTKRLPRLMLFQCPRLLGHVGPHEVVNFDYFRIECTEEFSGFFNSTLWKRLILQAAHTEHFILQAVLAIGALRRSQLSLPCTASKFGQNILRYCIEKYNVASRELRQRIQGGTADWRSAVLGSLVFLAIEVLQGHESGALMHLRNGVAILKSNLYSGARYPADTEDLAAAFTRLSVEEFPFFGLRTFVPPAMPRQPAYFADFKEAGTSLNTIVTVVYNFVRRHGTNNLELLPLHPLPDTVAAGLAELQESLNSWLQEFENLLFLQGHDIDSSLSASVLKLQYLVIWIKLSTYFLFDEMAYDQYLPHFEEVLKRSESVIESKMGGYSKSKGPCFTLDIAMAQPLYFVARKCREPSLRRRAIEIMKKVGKEGIYTGRTVAKVAEWIVAAEEGGDSSGEVVRERRFHDVSFDFHPATRTATVLATRWIGYDMWERDSIVLDLC